MTTSAERASADDRAWFDAHPDRNFRTRLPVKGEASDFGMQHAGMVLVKRLGDGARVRIPLYFPMVMPPSVVDGKEITEPEPIRPPLSEITGTSEEECLDLWNTRVPAETRAGFTPKRER